MPKSYYAEVPPIEEKELPKFGYSEVPPTDEDGEFIPVGKSAGGDKRGAAADKEK